MGSLLREPGLFHMTLTDGRTIDEALTPAEMATPEGRELYGLLYEQLAEGRELTLAALLADFAERGLDRLAGMAAAMEAEVDAMVAAGASGSMNGGADVLPQKLAAAAERLIAHHRGGQRRESPIEGGEPDEALRRAMELRRVNRSPLNIMRPRD